MRYVVLELVKILSSGERMLAVIRMRFKRR